MAARGVLVPYYEQCLRLRLAAQILRLPSDCVCTALTLYHRFKRSATRSSDEQLTVAASLFCASKLEETECRTVDLLNVVAAVFRQSHGLKAICPGSLKQFAPLETKEGVMTGDAYYAEKEKLVAMEHKLLRAIGFDVVVPRPMRELLTLCRDAAVERGVVEVAVRLMNDVLAYTGFVLRYESSAVVVSVVHTALLLTDRKLETKDGARRQKWYECLGFDEEVVETIGHQIVDVICEVSEQTMEASRMP